MSQSEKSSAGSFLSDDPSFSVIYFAGDVRDGIPSLLTDCGYLIIERATYDGPFQNLLNQISRIPVRKIVSKAMYSISSGTVLVDPEMVVGTGDDAPLQAFCSMHHTVARVAIWERFTKSVIARQINDAGVNIDFLSIDGNTSRKPVNPPADLVRWPGPDRLREFLAASGARTDQIFGKVSAQVFKLGETRIDPPERRI